MERGGEDKRRGGLGQEWREGWGRPRVEREDGTVSVGRDAGSGLRVKVSLWFC